MNFHPRELLADERLMTNTLRIRTEKAERNRIQPYHYVITGALGVGCAWVAMHTGHDLLMLLFGTVAVFVFGFIVFGPFEVAKLRRRHRDFLCRLMAFIDRGTVATLPIEATKIALVPEREDEGDLYIVELADSQVLHIRDLEYNLKMINRPLRHKNLKNECKSTSKRQKLEIN